MLVIEVEILELLNCEGPINGVKYIRRGGQEVSGR